MTRKALCARVATTASVKDVARAAGVSVGTVSNVLNRPELVAEGTRHRVLAAIGGSATSATIRAPAARRRSRTIALVVLDIANPFFTDVARGAEEARRAARPRRDRVQQRRATPSGGATTSTSSRSTGCAAFSSRPSTPRPAAGRLASRDIPSSSSTAGAERRRLFGLRRRRRGRRARRRPPARPGPPSGSRSSAARRAAAVPDRRRALARRAEGAGRRRWCARDRALDVAAGREAGARLAGLPAPADGGLLRERPGRAGCAPGAARAGCGCRARWPWSATTTSSSRRPPRCR